MNTEDFARILFLALDDTDEKLAGLAGNVKADIEREDIEAASAGVRAMTERMGELRRIRETVR